jgi:multicomponent Na+:H+ antiporter subunit G
MISMVVALSLLVIGMTFICIAAFGVAKLPDVFQRMHSATKAGGIGTTLVVLGVLMAGDIVRPLTGILTIGFMLLTLSVASQLLSRAAYMSGATVHGLEGRDALAGVLDRQKAPLEERTDTAEDAGD